VPSIRAAIARSFEPDERSIGIRGLGARKQEPKPEIAPPHRFFDRANVTLTAVEVGVMLADGATTQYGLRNHPGSREANPLARPFVNAGWPGMIAGGAMVVSGEVGLRYLLHRKNHHRWERWIPVFVIADSALGAIHNAIVLSDLDSHR
jgi:hypothetical protein